MVSWADRDHLFIRATIDIILAEVLGISAGTGRQLPNRITVKARAVPIIHPPDDHAVSKIDTPYRVNLAAEQLERVGHSDHGAVGSAQDPDRIEQPLTPLRHVLHIERLLRIISRYLPG